MTINPYVCSKCGNQANNLFDDFSESYQYKIKEESEQVYKVFKPIEFEKENNND